MRPQRRHRRLKTAGIGAAVFVVVAGGISAALIAFLALRGTADVLSKLTPAGTAFYLSIYLDPPSAQKSNFNNLLHRFPDVKDDQQRDQKVNDIIDEALKTSHLNHNDVRAWLGSQVAVIAPADALSNPGRSSSGAPPFAVLISSTDDRKAQSTLDSFRGNGDGKAFTWTDGSHDGVSVATGTSGSGGAAVLYGVVSHAAIVSSSESLMNDIIDTAHGKRSSLDGSDTFKKTISGLPADHLALGYVDMSAVAGKLKDALHKSGSGGSASSTQSLDSVLDAFRGVGMTLSAESNGLALDANSYIDTSKLTDEQRRLRQSVAGSSGANSTITSMPAGAYGFLAFGGADKIVQSVSGLLGSVDPSVQQGFEKIGLTGPNGIGSHLTGDAGVEVGPRSDTKIPGGALLLATNDDAAMSRFLGNLADATAVGVSADASSAVHVEAPVPGLPMPAGAGAVEPAQPPAVAPPARATAGRLTAEPVRIPAAAQADLGVVHVKVTYRGVEITTAGTLASDPHGILPSYAVSKGIGILGTSVDDVKAAIDAQSGAGIASTGAYRDAIAQAPKGSATGLYVNIPAVVAAVRDTLSQADRTAFDHSAAADVAPFKSLIITGQSSGDHDSVRVFVAVG